MTNWWFRLSQYARPQWRGVVAVISLILLTSIFTALRPWPLKLIVDYVIGERVLPESAKWLYLLPGAATAPKLLLWLAIGSLGIVAAAEFFQVVRMYLQTGLGARMIFALGEAMFEQYQRLSLAFHGRTATGDLVRRGTVDVTCIQDLVLGVYMTVVAAMANLVFMVVIMWRIDADLTFVALLIILPLAVLIRMSAAPMMARAYEQQRTEGELMTVAERTLTALPMVQAMGAEGAERARFQLKNERAYEASLKATWTQVLFTWCTAALTAVGVATLVILGGREVLRENMTLGDLLVFLAYIAALYAPLEVMAYVSTGFHAAGAKAKRVLEVLDLDERIPEPPVPRQLPIAVGGRAVQFTGVNFGYKPGQEVLSDFSLSVATGESIAFVGPTGAGKSTAVALLPRFHDVRSGSITFDGVDIRDVTTSHLRDQIAIVPQEPLLLPRSVLENIAYGRPHATQDDVIAAAIAAGCHQFIENMPGGYEAIIGERGVTLSGGEKQRISIARAFLRDAPILILDEPTSALDSDNEALVVDSIRKIIKHRTTFIVAHRLSTIQHVDRVVFIDGGRIIEQGSHDELLTARGRYWQFYEIQRGGKT